ncbi:MAG: hypothetical protein RL011_1061 [Pseudomonadota bacterium]
MHELSHTLDRAILGLITKSHERASNGQALESAAFATTAYIQAFGKRMISDEINRRLVVLKNLMWDMQHALPRGAELYEFYANACDVYEKRFDYATYISDYLLHAVPATDCFAQAVDRRLRDMSFIVARLYQVEAARPKLLPQRMIACVHVLSQLEQVESHQARELLASGRDQIPHSQDALSLMQGITESMIRDSRYFALHCSLLPTSADRSELLFLSVVQLNEICFDLWIDALRQILTSVTVNRVNGETISVAEELCRLAKLAVACVSILNDFTHDEFMMFRHYTENAGAIQSRKYKELELYTCNFVEDRIRQKGYDALPYLKELSGYPELRLYQLVKSLDPSTEVKRLQELLEQFEKHVMDWKRFHIYIARTRLLNHGAPEKERLDHYLSSSIKPTFKSGPSPS